jgi:hypothetical protein
MADTSANAKGKGVVAEERGKGAVSTSGSKPVEKLRERFGSPWVDDKSIFTRDEQLDEIRSSRAFLGLKTTKKNQEPRVRWAVECPGKDERICSPCEPDDE